MTDNNTVTNDVVEQPCEPTTKKLTRKTIILIVCCGLAVALAVVLCLVFIGGSLSSLLVTNDISAPVDNVVKLEQLEGISLTNTICNGELGLYYSSEYGEESQVSVYNFQTEEVLGTYSAGSILSWLPELGVVMFGVMDEELFDDNGKSVWYYTVVQFAANSNGDYQCTELLQFDTSVDYTYTSSYLYVDGEAVMYVCPDDGRVAVIDADYLGILFDGDYDYYNDDVYMVLDSVQNALYCYSRDTLQLSNVVDLSAYYTSGNTVNLYVLANDNVYMQVATQLDSMEDDYDYILYGTYKYDLHGYIINTSTGNITSRNVDFLVHAVENIYTESALEGTVKDSVNIATVTYITDKQCQTRTEVVLATGNMNVKYQLDDLHVGIDYVAQFEDYYIATDGMAAHVFDKSGNMIAYDVTLLSQTMFIKNNNVYLLDGTLVRKYNSQENIVGSVYNSVLYYILEDNGDIVYYLDDTEIEGDVDEIAIIGDGYLVIDQVTTKMFTYTYYNSSGVELFQQELDYLDEMDITVLEDYMIVRIGLNYYKIS